jgi:integrase
MSPQLAWYLRQWRRMTPYAKDDDWVFPSFKMNGKIPMCAGIFVTDHLRPAASKAGIQIAQGQRFGLHSLRSSMATWMVSIDKTDVKTAQGNMRHAGPEIMLRKYAQVVTPEMQGVQVRWFESWCGVRICWQKTPGVMQSNEPKRVLGERGRIRTCDPCLKRALLYQLSYAPSP